MEKRWVCGSTLRKQRKQSKQSFNIKSRSPQKDGLSLAAKKHFRYLGSYISSTEKDFPGEESTILECTP